MSKRSEDTVTDIAAAIAAGREAAGIAGRVHIAQTGGLSLPMVLLDAGQSLAVPKELLAELDRRLPQPQRRRGESMHQDLASFLAHLKRFMSPESVVWADIATMRLTCVYNYHDAKRGPGWCDHRAAYVCPRASAWLAWSKRDGNLMTQQDLADFIEERYEDLTSGGKTEDYPAPAAILEMARKLQLHTKGRYERSVHPTTGAYELVCKLETEATSTPIPRAFLVALPVFDGGDLYKLEARLRLQIRDAAPLFSFVLHRRAEVERDAFEDIKKRVHGETGLVVFGGTPEA